MLECQKWRILICRFREHICRYILIHRVRQSKIEICKERKRPSGGKRHRSKARVRERGSVSARVLSAVLIPRSSINETRVQSRRMSNKYVSYPFRFTSPGSLLPAGTHNPSSGPTPVKCTRYVATSSTPISSDESIMDDLSRDEGFDLGSKI